jgi:hypothetical protein
LSTAVVKARERRESMIDYLAASGLALSDIATRVGITLVALKKYLRTPDSILRVEEINRRIREQIISEASRIGEMLDSEVPQAFKTLRRLNRGITDDIANPVPHAVSLAAAKEIIGMAPGTKSLRTDPNDGSKHLHIHLPEKQFANAQQALADVGVVLDLKPQPQEPPESEDA